MFQISGALLALQRRLFSYDGIIPDRLGALSDLHYRIVHGFHGRCRLLHGRCESLRRLRVLPAHALHLLGRIGKLKQRIVQIRVGCLDILHHGSEAGPHLPEGISHAAALILPFAEPVAVLILGKIKLGCLGHDIIDLCDRPGNHQPHDHADHNRDRYSDEHTYHNKHRDAAGRALHLRFGSRQHILHAVDQRSVTHILFQPLIGVIDRQSFQRRVSQRALNYARCFCLCDCRSRLYLFMIRNIAACIHQKSGACLKHRRMIHSCRKLVKGNVHTDNADGLPVHHNGNDIRHHININIGI